MAVFNAVIIIILPFKPQRVLPSVCSVVQLDTTITFSICKAWDILVSFNSRMYWFFVDC